jgi:hypothetical protein
MFKKFPLANYVNFIAFLMKSLLFEKSIKLLKNAVLIFSLD